MLKFIESKKAQEEMVGFALIIIIVAVILLIFLGISLRTPQKEPVESYEVNSFIQTFLEYTSDCRDVNDYFTIQDLIYLCNEEETCLNGKTACETLNATLTDLVGESWLVGGDRPSKGYVLNITIINSEIFSLKKGNMTRNYKGGVEYLTKEVDVFFTVYS